MTMKELIRNILMNYRETNNNPGQQPNAALREQIVSAADDILDELDNNDTISLTAIGDLLAIEGAASDSATELQYLKTRLDFYSSQIQTCKNLEADEKQPGKFSPIPFVSATKFTGDEIELLPYADEWIVYNTRSDEYTDKALAENMHLNFSKNRVPFLRKGQKGYVYQQVNELINANNVYFGSTEYNDFLRGMEELSELMQNTRILDSEEIKNKYAQVQSLGQRYLARKTEERHAPNPKRRRRINLVTKIVTHLTILQANIDANDKILEHKRKFDEEHPEAVRQKPQQHENVIHEPQQQENVIHEPQLQENGGDNPPVQYDEQIEENMNMIYEMAADKVNNVNPKVQQPKVPEEKPQSQEDKLYQEAVADLEFLRDIKNSLTTSYHNPHYERLKTYLTRLKNGEPLKPLDLSAEEFAKITELDVVSDNLSYAQHAYGGGTYMPFEHSNLLWRTYEHLYQVYFRPNYISEGADYGFYISNFGDTFANRDSVHYMLAHTKAFTEHADSMEQNQKNYRDFVLHPEKQEQVFKNLMQAGLQELKATLKDQIIRQKETLPYLLDYRHFVNTEYQSKAFSFINCVHAMRLLPEYEGNGAAPRTLADVLKELGITEKQYEKVVQLSNAETRYYAPNTHQDLFANDNENAGVDRGIFKKTMCILGDIYFHPAFLEPGNEVPLPDNPDSTATQFTYNPAYNKIFDSLNTEAQLFKDMRDPESLSKGMTRLTNEVSSVMSEKQISSIKETVKYLENYQNILSPNYIKKARVLDNYLAKTALFDLMSGQQHDHLKDIGLNQQKYEKIELIAHEVCDQVQEFLNHLDDGHPIGDDLNIALRMLTDIFGSPAMIDKSGAGDEMPLPESLYKKGTTFNKDYDVLYEGLPTYQNLEKELDLAESLKDFLTNDSEYLRETFMKLYAESAAAGRVAKYNASHPDAAKLYDPAQAKNVKSKQEAPKKENDSANKKTDQQLAGPGH